MRVTLVRCYHDLLVDDGDGGVSAVVIDSMVDGKMACRGTMNSFGNAENKSNPSSLVLEAANDWKAKTCCVYAAILGLCS